MKIIYLDKKLSESQYDNFGMDILKGLSSFPKRISAKYFYDDLGSELFKKITEQQEYYLTKKEFSILEKISSLLPNLINEKEKIDIIELGAGDGHKTKLLIDGFIHKGIKVNYYPIDISEKAMLFLEKNIIANSELEINGIVSDYLNGLSHVCSFSKNVKLVLFLGANIGNLEQSESLKFLSQLKTLLHINDFILIGFDLKKNVDILNKAYNDSAGITHRFNFNLLNRINKELGGNFIENKFQHYGFYNPVQGAMESYLISLEEQDVYIKKLEKSFHVAKYEPIHLEYSFKFLPAEIDNLCVQSGFSPIKHFVDEEMYFIDSLWKVL